jgi:hypothetical protein
MATCVVRWNEKLPLRVQPNNFAIAIYRPVKLEQIAKSWPGRKSVGLPLISEIEHDRYARLH